MSKEQVNYHRQTRPSSDKEKIALCRQWKASKLTLESFCKEHGVAKSSLYTWYKKFGLNASTEIVPARPFMPLTPVDEPSKGQEKVLMELKLHDGGCLQLSLLLSDAVILIRELSHAAAVIR